MADNSSKGAELEIAEGTSNSQKASRISKGKGVKGMASRTSDADTDQSSQSARSKRSTKGSQKGSDAGSQKGGKLNSLLDSMRKGFGFCIGKEMPDIGTDESESTADDRSNVLCTGMINPSVEVTDPCCGKGTTDEDATQYEETTNVTFQEPVKEIEELVVEETKKPPEPSTTEKEAAESIKSTLSESITSVTECGKSKKKKAKPSIASTVSGTPKAVAQGLIFPPSPRQSLNDMLAKSPREIPMTLFSNNELEDMFKPDTIIPNMNMKIHRTPSFAALDSLKPSNIKFCDESKSLYESFVDYFQKPVDTGNEFTRVTEVQCHEPH